MMQANPATTTASMTAESMEERASRAIDAMAERALALGFLAALGVWMMLAG